MNPNFIGWDETPCRPCEGKGTSFDPTFQDAISIDITGGRCPLCQGSGNKKVGILRPEIVAAQAAEAARIRATYTGDDSADLPDWMC